MKLSRACVLNKTTGHDDLHPATFEQCTIKCQLLQLGPRSAAMQGPLPAPVVHASEQCTIPHQQLDQPVQLILPCSKVLCP